MYDYSKLLGRLRELGHTQADLADAIGIHFTTLTKKLKNRTEFTQTEMLDALNFLSVPEGQILDYFFRRS